MAYEGRTKDVEVTVKLRVPVERDESDLAAELLTVLKGEDKLDRTVTVLDVEAWQEYQGEGA